MSASADRFRRVLRSSFESQFREATRASEVLRRTAEHLRAQRFEELLPDLLMSGSPWETAKRGLSEISRIQDEVANAIGEPEVARLQELSRIQDEISREATRASEALREVIKSLPDISISKNELSGVLGGLESSAFYEPEPRSSSSEAQEAPRDELMEQMSHDLAAIRRHMERWWISVILVFLLTLLAGIVSPLLQEMLSPPEEPPKEGILREVDDAE